MKITPVVREDGVLLATWRNVLLNVGKGNPSKEFIDQVLQHAEDLLSVYPDGIVLMLLIYDGGGVPGGKGRGRATQMLREIGPRLQALAAVIEGAGFWASAARSILTGLALMSRSRFPLRTFSEMNEAARWLVKYIQPPVPLEELQAAMKELDEARREPRPARRA